MQFFRNTSPLKIISINLIIFKCSDSLFDESKKRNENFKTLLERSSVTSFKFSEKREQIEFESLVVKDFIQNYKRSGMFSLLCLESCYKLMLTTNDLQKKLEFYGFDVESCLKDFPHSFNMGEGVENERSENPMSLPVLKVCNRGFIPKNNESILPKDERFLRLFEIYDKCEIEVIKESTLGWVKEKTNGKITDLDLSLLYSEGCRLYLTVLYFKGDWRKRFLKVENEENFYLRGGNIEKRRFMEIKETFANKLISIDGDLNKKFHVVIVPYRNKNDICANNERQIDRNTGFYMYYLIPYVGEKDRSESSIPDLAEMWDSFSKQLINDISDISPDFCDVELKVPLIENLRTNFNADDVFINTLKLGSSTITTNVTTFISINETGTEAAVLANTTCVDGAVKTVKLIANRPYICFVYNKDIKRIVCFVKDNGNIEND